MNCRPPLGSNTPHIVGTIAAALILAGPLARAETPSSPGVESTSVQAEAHAPEQSRSDAPRDSGFIPGVLIGPRLSVAVPTPTIGVEAKILRYFGLAFDYGLTPKLDISGVSVSYEMWDVAVRVYPFGHTFFVGAVYGHYGVEAVGSTPQGSGSVRASSNFLGPQNRRPVDPAERLLLRHRPRVGLPARLQLGGEPRSHRHHGEHQADRGSVPPERYPGGWPGVGGLAVLRVDWTGDCGPAPSPGRAS